MNKKQKQYKHHRAITLLTEEMNRLAGVVFARYYAEKCGGESLKTVESMEFLGQLFTGKLSAKDQSFLEPYLLPLWEINASLNLLIKEGFEEEEKENDEKTECNL